MKDNNKQTAVEWLVKELKDNGIDLDLAYEIIEQANQMFQEQIQDAWNNGAENWDAEMEGDDYYNETFGDTK
jgi:hypothetical protein